ncbi:MAG TPA: NifU family protein [Bacteroidales bacterium]|nr:NifU family protein [Bacteroidales bacterium]HQG37045.1 NifU family protein [Bacteroidales bacterium]HQG53564.1 NifU family protein [Bacteroidales bacterium]HQJ21185.1 NifU family protein [Bacteroidales bacterium]
MTEKEQLKERITIALNKIRPFLQSDGGDIDLVEITDDNTIKVKLQGACHGCPFSIQTLKAGVEQAIIREVPEIKRVIAVD